MLQEVNVRINHLEVGLRDDELCVTLFFQFPSGALKWTPFKMNDEVDRYKLERIVNYVKTQKNTISMRGELSTSFFGDIATSCENCDIRLLLNDGWFVVAYGHPTEDKFVESVNERGCVEETFEEIRAILKSEGFNV